MDLFGISYNLQRRKHWTVQISPQDVDGIIRRNLPKIHNVFEIPTYDHSAIGSGRQRDVMRVLFGNRFENAHHRKLVLQRLGLDVGENPLLTFFGQRVENGFHFHRRSGKCLRLKVRSHQVRLPGFGVFE